MKKIITLLLLSCVAITALASTSTPLDKWTTWVRENHPDIDCPRVSAGTDERHCAWPGKLQITVDEKGAQFEQAWQISAATWIVLPGNKNQWPLEVTSNGSALAVIEREQLPMAKLEQGSYILRGRIVWNEPPQFIYVPAQTALLELRRDGKTIAATSDSENRIWLRNSALTQSDGSDSTKIEVYRRIDDNLPREMTTVLRLSVAGKARELLIGRFLLKDLEPTQFESPLPARIEDDGRLRIQARAGQWTLVLHARFVGDINRFRTEHLDEQWPTQEIWSFAANQSLRRVKVSGAQTVDPSQIDLPEGFVNLPTYLMQPDNELVLEQQDRGDARPAANELSLDKTVWLDFNGAGATVRDLIRGHMSQSWRLDAAADLALGRATVDGEPQLITHINKDDPGGVEIREANVNVDAVSRVNSLGNLSASGWNSEFNIEKLSLQLPPGWMLWHAAGPDVVWGSWISHWNLWNIFLTLLLVVAIYKLFDWRIAMLALATICLTYHESESPVFFYIPILIAIALLRVLTAPKLNGVIVKFGYLFAIGLVVTLLSFAVAQIRTAIYPQLEILRDLGAQRYGPIETKVIEEAKGKTAPEELIVTARRQESVMANAPIMAAASYSSPRQQRYQPDSNVQTGPGIPTWSWRSATLQWSGSITAKESLHLYLTGPWLTRLIKIVNVLLSSALTLILLSAFWRARGRSDKGLNASLNTAPALLVLVALGVIVAHIPNAVADEFPPKYLLDEFEQRLIKQPDCLPDCASIDSVLVKASNDRITFYLRVSAGSAIGLPLPVIANWQPQSVLVDGVQKSFVARLGDEQLIPLISGHHDIVIDGPLSSDDVTVQFALPPHDVSVTAEQWDVFGLNARQLSANTLQLQKHQRNAVRDTLVQEPAKAFVRVTRTFNLDIDWTLTTTVTRIAPLQGAINLSLPLIAGESVVSNGVATKDGKIDISLGSQQNEFLWVSVLQKTTGKPASPLRLTAPEAQQWVESWEVAASPKWHVTSAGLTPVKNAGPIKSNGENAARWNWQPWPGESVSLNIAQPTAIQGATTTIENATVILSAANHGSELSLQFDVASSVGGDYHVELKESSELKSVKLNGVDISQSRNEDKIVLPLNPGKNHAEIHWRLSSGTSFVMHTPTIVFDTPANNIELQVKLQQDRWPLWLSGPNLGPAMLLWGELVVIIGLAFGLGALVRRAQLSIPLGPLQWALLGIGMSTISVVGSLPIVLWFFALEARSRLPLPSRRGLYNLMQIGIVLLTFIAAMSLLSTIPRSLLSTPDMQVTGNNSYNYFYQWYQDHSGGILPTAVVFSVSIWIYRLTMLLWSLWLVFSLMRWIKWGWQTFNSRALWKSKIDNASVPAGAGTTESEVL